MPKRETSQNPSRLVGMKLSRDIPLLCSAVTLAFSPSLTIDAFNPPKFAVLILGTTYLSLRYWRFFRETLKNSIIQIWLLCYLLVLTLILFINHYSISERLFGFQGRNLGYITITAFLLLILYSYTSSRFNQSFLTSVIRGLAWTNLVVCSIFFLQDRGILFTNFQNDYGVLPSTLGNPNFLSSFLGISTVAVLTLVFERDQNLVLRIAYVGLALYATFAIFKSGSIQGLLALGVSSLTFLLFLALRVFNRLINYFVFLTVGVTLILSVFGFLGLGPFGSSLRQQTFINRFVYWKVATRIVRDSPLFGKGFDSYNDYYREFVTDSDFQLLGGPVISDSPHNVFLDIFVSGGLLLGSIFLASIVFVFSRGLKKLKVSLDANNANVTQVFPFAIFLAFVSVCLISPFQLGLFVWFPIIIALLLGDTSYLKPSKSSNFWAKPNFTNFVSSLVLIFSLVLCNPFFALLPMVTENRFRHSVETGNFNKLKSVALAWPFSGSRAISIAQGFLNSTFNPALGVPGPDNTAQIEALKRAAESIAVVTTSINSRQYEAWKFLFENTREPSVKAVARAKLMKIDPTNPNWKQTP